MHGVDVVTVITATLTSASGLRAVRACLMAYMVVPLSMASSMIRILGVFLPFNIFVSSSDNDTAGVCLDFVNVSFSESIRDSAILIKSSTQMGKFLRILVTTPFFRFVEGRCSMTSVLSRYADDRKCRQNASHTIDPPRMTPIMASNPPEGKSDSTIFANRAACSSKASLFKVKTCIGV